MTTLSVVLISRNQEWNAARLIESVLRETQAMRGTEIVLVDSASTDRTTEIAAHYPIAVLKLSPNQRLTAAAGRCVGHQRTTGDFVLFLDGDMALYPGWLDHAVQTMLCKPEVAVVCGHVIDRPLEYIEGPVNHLQGPISDVNYEDVRQSGGAAMYRRTVLEQVGGFNPYLYSDEEPASCLRIRHAKYRVIRLSHPIAFHYTAPAQSLSTFLGKWRADLWLGYGQNIRYFAGTPLLWAYLTERGWAAAPAAVLTAGLASGTASLLYRQRRWVSIWAASVTMLMIGIAVRKRSLRDALLAMLRRLFILDGTLRGVMLEPHDPAGYVASFDLVQDGYD